MRRSSSARIRCVPATEAMTPPRSMSPTRMTGTSARVAKPILAMSRDRRLISAGDPAPSTMTRSAPSPTLAQESSTAFHQLRFHRTGSRAPWPRRRPCPAPPPGSRYRFGVSAAPGSCGRWGRRRRPSPAAIARGRSRHRLLARNVGDGGVVGHVLRLERPHLHAAIPGRAAQAGDQHGLAHIRAGALKHDRARHLVSARSVRPRPSPSSERRAGRRATDRARAAAPRLSAWRGSSSMCGE